MPSVIFAVVLRFAVFSVSLFELCVQVAVCPYLGIKTVYFSISVFSFGIQKGFKFA